MLFWGLGSPQQEPLLDSQRHSLQGQRSGKQGICVYKMQDACWSRPPTPVNRKRIFCDCSQLALSGP